MPVAPRMPTSIVIVVSLYPTQNKKADAVVSRSAVGRSLCNYVSALAHTDSDRAGPLSAKTRSLVGGDVHENGSIAHGSCARPHAENSRPAGGEKCGSRM